MTSTITLYQTNITPERNCRVDSLTSYLASCTSETINDFQYKTIKLDDFIKLNRNQEDTPSFPFNYLSVVRGDDSKIYYYFILNTSWKSANTVELQISLDTINTFWNELKWTAKTNITRQHKDRFQKKAVVSGINTFKKIIDRYDEGITPVKTVTSKDKLLINNADYDWHLIYRSVAAGEQPLECLCCANEEITINETADHNGLTPGDYAPGIGSTIIFLSRDNEDFTYTASDGKTYQIGKDKQYKGVSVQLDNNNNFTYVMAISTERAGNKQMDFQRTSTIMSGLRLVGYYVYRTDSNGVERFNQLNTYDYALSYYEKYSNVAERVVLGDTTVQSATLKSISSIDRTDSKIVKIIKMPYAPFELSFTSGNMNVPNGWQLTTTGYLRLNDLNAEFLTTVLSTTMYDLARTINKEGLLDVDIQNDQRYESKLYNSNFYSVKYYYDNFNKEFLYERNVPSANIDNTARLEIKFKQSNNISSNSLFDFTVKYDNYQEPTLYSQYLNANRQNEMALFTSEYLNYIRTGYNYDLKLKRSLNAANITGSVLSSVGALASFASSVWTGAAGIAAGISFTTSALATISNTVASVNNNEISLQQKLDQLKQQASSVSNTEDLNLLKYYNGNRLIKTVEQCSDEMRDAIYQLFRLTGYACNDYAVPDFNSRCYYNFVQCKPDVDESQWSYGKDFLDDIRARFAVGVTVYHKFRDKYNWKLDLENFEVWLVSGN